MRRVAVLGCVPRKLLTRDPGVVLCPHFINEDTEALESRAPCLWGPKARVSHATVVVSSLNYARASSGAKCPHIHPSGVSGGRKNSPPHSCIKPIMGGLALSSVTDRGTVETGGCVWNRDLQLVPQWRSALGPRSVPLTALPPSAPARQPRGRLPHPEDAPDGPRCPPHHSRAAERGVLHFRLHPRPPAHHLPHRPTQVLPRSQQPGPRQPEASLRPQQR